MYIYFIDTHYSNNWERGFYTALIAHLLKHGQRPHKTVTTARYDGDDYLPELSGIKFRTLKPQTINGQNCNVYEQKGSNTLLRIFELKGKGVPISVVLTTNGAKIEMVFSNYVYNKVTAKDMSY